jgi:hypothetical protein
MTMLGLFDAGDNRPLPGRDVSIHEPWMQALFDDATINRSRQEREEYEAEIERMVTDALIPKYPDRKQLSAGTLKSYGRLFDAFKRFCAEADITALPARPGFVASYLHVCATEGLSRQQIGKIAAAIKYAHEVDGYADPTASDLVDAIIASLKPPKRIKANGHAH